MTFLTLQVSYRICHQITQNELKKIIIVMLFLQTLLASGYSQQNYDQARGVIYRVLQVEILLFLTVSFSSLIDILFFLHLFYGIDTMAKPNLHLPFFEFLTAWPSDGNWFGSYIVHQF